MRQNQPAFDFEQRASHLDEFAGRRQIELLEHSQVLDELLGDRRDRDVGDLDLVLTHQIQEQVERPAKDRQLDLKIHA